MNLEPCSRDHREGKVNMQSSHNSGFNKNYRLIILVSFAEDDNRYEEAE